MNSFSKSLLGFIFFVIVPPAGFSQVIENDAVLLRGSDVVFIGDYNLGLSQTTSFDGGESQGLFLFGIDDLGNDLFRFDYQGIAEFYSLFPVEQGDVLTPSVVNFLNNTMPFAANINFNDPAAAPPIGELTLATGESVYLGYWDDRSPQDDNLLGAHDAADADDNFGWLELSRSDRLDSSFGQLEILGGATAIGSGIIVGTTSTVAIPEPSADILIGLLAAAGLFRRRRL